MHEITPKSPNVVSGPSLQQPEECFSIGRQIPPATGVPMTGLDKQREEEEVEEDEEDEGGNDQHTYEQWPVASELHEAGQCKPCLYLMSRSGCYNGRDCKFCHLPHTKKNRSRPCKMKRNQAKQLVNLLDVAFGHNSSQFQQASLKLSSESPYLRSLLKSWNGSPPNQNTAGSAGSYSAGPLMAPPMPASHGAMGSQQGAQGPVMSL